MVEDGELWLLTGVTPGMDRDHALAPLASGQAPDTHLSVHTSVSCVTHVIHYLCLTLAWCVIICVMCDNNMCATMDGNVVQLIWKIDLASSE